MDQDQLIAELQARIVNLESGVNANLQQTAAAAQHAAAAAAAAAARLPRLKPPPPAFFNGEKTMASSGDTAVGVWLFSCERYFDAIGGLTEQERVTFAIALLRGNALQWGRTRHTAMANLTADAAVQLNTWAAFCAAITADFQPINNARVAREKLATIRQERSVQDYVSRFRAIMIQVEDLTEAEARDRFMRGLKLEPRREVELRNPATLDDMMRLADRYDAVTFPYQQQRKRDHRGRYNNGNRTFDNQQEQWRPPVQPAYPSGPGNGGGGPSPMELGAMMHQRHSTMTDEERRRLQQEGRCFYCKEKGHIAPLCPKKKGNNGGQQRR
jgi:hypothetical protein